MSGFKNTTRTMHGFRHWSGGAVGGGTGGTINRLARGGGVDKIDSNPGHAEVYPKEGNRMQGNALTQRKESPTQELTEHGGKTPLISKFKKGGSTPKHFHVHKHYHAKGGRTHSVSHSYATAEKHAETFAEGGHVHDSTRVPSGGPDYKRGGKARPVKKNAGGAMYAPGGTVQGSLARLAARPAGLPMRGAPPMRRPVGIPGPGGLAGALAAARTAQAPTRAPMVADPGSMVRTPAMGAYKGPINAGSAMARGGKARKR